MLQQQQQPSRKEYLHFGDGGKKLFTVLDEAVGASGCMGDIITACRQLSWI